jgi:hypothetical protein
LYTPSKIGVLRSQDWGFQFLPSKAQQQGIIIIISHNEKQKIFIEVSDRIREG